MFEYFASAFIAFQQFRFQTLLCHRLEDFPLRQSAPRNFRQSDLTKKMLIPSARSPRLESFASRTFRQKPTNMILKG